MVLYMEITKDKFELPLAVADSVEELAKLRNVSRYTIYRSISDVNVGKKKKSKYLKIKIEEKE